ncbi:DUF2953 domain-containing protein [Caldalkalibacillus salinus]|uniref:DUF2953 domain-containing protein n=1 Tax=Caldalkalibacillus salinus TaxID=2803787 RepID=UPI0019220CEB|nr:DUF2953 domain-containing protein [Caldalkalibacillus salinus]
MQVVLAIFLAWIIFFIIILFTQVQVTIHVQRKGANDKLKTKVMAWFGLIHLETETPIVKLQGDMTGAEYQMELKSPNMSLDESSFKVTPNEATQIQSRLLTVIQRVHHLHVVLKRFLKTIHLLKFEWRTSIGTGDAAETGVISGIAWSTKAAVVGVIQTYLSLRALPRFAVKPHFQEKKIETELRCMIRLRIGNAILAGIRMLLNLRKRRDVKWQSTQFKA